MWERWREERMMREENDWWVNNTVYDIEGNLCYWNEGIFCYYGTVVKKGRE